MPQGRHSAVEMISPIKMWRRITATRYTRALEAEVARLRAENRALLNSILGIAGVPPITVLSDSDFVGAQHAVPADTMPTKRSGSRHGSGVPGSSVTSAARSARIGEAPSLTTAPANGNARGANIIAPVRRRSWHQIYRLLEMDSTKKKPEHKDTRLRSQEKRSAPAANV